MQTFYPHQILRAFRQAPWRQQTRLLSGLFIGLTVLLLLGGLYLAVATRAGNAGRDLQALEARKAELLRSNDRLRAQLAGLRSLDRLAGRALELGFVPAVNDQVAYLAVPGYPAAAAAPAELAADPAPAAPAADWLGRLWRLVLGGG